MKGGFTWSKSKIDRIHQPACPGQVRATRVENSPQGIEETDPLAPSSRFRKDKAGHASISPSSLPRGERPVCQLSFPGNHSFSRHRIIRLHGQKRTRRHSQGKDSLPPVWPEAWSGERRTELGPSSTLIPPTRRITQVSGMCIHRH